MSVIEISAPGATAQDHALDFAASAGRHRRAETQTAWSRLLVGSLAFAVVSCAAFTVRSIGLSRGFELWVDEMLYADLGRSVSLGQLPTLPDGPFFLHPPGFFLVVGAYIDTFGISTSGMNLVYDLRWINAVIGALSVGIAFLLARRVATKPISLLVAVVLAFEPFVLRNNSRVFLETLAFGLALAGLLILVIQLGRLRDRWEVARLGSAGLLMGFGILTKDLLALYVVVPVVLAIFWRNTLRLRQAVVLLIGIAAPYAVYLTILASKDLLGDWIWAKTSGTQRLLGLEQSTGFNAAGSPSIGSRLVDQLGQFGTSYILLAICPVVGVIACLSRTPERRMVGLTTLCIGAFGAYSAVFGTFEEQYGYGVMLASVLGAAVCAAECNERRPALIKVLATCGFLFAVVTVGLGLRTELTTDNGFQQVQDWVAVNLPADARVSVTNSTGELAFANDPRFGVWPSLPLMAENGANYILTQSLPTSQGYGYAMPTMLGWLSANAQQLFGVGGPTNGATVLWYVNSEKLAQGAAMGIGYPSATYETER